MVPVLSVLTEDVRRNKALLCVVQMPCHPNNMKIPRVLLAAMVLNFICNTRAAQQSEDSAMENARDDARTLLQEAEWAEAFGWNLTTSMCQWPAVQCDNSSTSVIAL